MNLIGFDGLTFDQLCAWSRLFIFEDLLKLESPGTQGRGDPKDPSKRIVRDIREWLNIQGKKA